MEMEYFSRHAEWFSAFQLLSAVTVVTVAALFAGYVRVYVLPLRGKKLPPGSMGLPLLGESISFFRAQKQDETLQWVLSRMEKHGPVFKTRLMGSDVVAVTGQAGNKFMFSGSDNGISSSSSLPIAKILGKQSIIELSGPRYKLVRSAIIGFLQPESLQKYVAHMDVIIKQQLLQKLKDKDTVKVVPLMKQITFNLTCRILFGLESGEVNEQFDDFGTAVKGTWSLPLELPGTSFNAAMKARARIHKWLCDVLQRRRKQMEEGNKHRSKDDDVISSFLMLKDVDGKPLPDDDIIDNIISLMIGSHDTSSIVLSHFIRYISRNADVFHEVRKEHQDIANNANVRGGKDGNLSWQDTQLMRHTWKVAQELMRFTPPIFGNFRTATKDTSFGGFDIPKGWKLLWVASVTHMNKEIFEDPEKFNPARFESGSKTYPAYTYIPFGAGPRICPGAEFARVQISIIVHHLITNYDWEEMDPSEPIVREPLPYPALGLPIKLTPKKMA